MIKMVYTLRRLPHLSREEFQKYWHETHAPLVRKHQEALHLRRYVQVHTLTNPLNDVLQGSRGGPEAYDGVAELWWDSVEDLQAVLATPEGQQAGRELLEDERRFIDTERSPLWLAEERPIIS